MIDIELRDGQSGYDAIGEYVRRYWDHVGYDTVVVALGTSYHGDDFYLFNEIANTTDTTEVEFANDWWEGEKFIRIFGIAAVNGLDISGGIYQD